jgi:hypothetical protein
VASDRVLDARLIAVHVHPQNLTVRMLLGVSIARNVDLLPAKLGFVTPMTGRSVKAAASRVETVRANRVVRQTVLGTLAAVVQTLVQVPIEHLVPLTGKERVGLPVVDPIVVRVPTETVPPDHSAQPARTVQRTTARPARLTAPQDQLRVVFRIAPMLELALGVRALQQRARRIVRVHGALLRDDLPARANALEESAQPLGERLASLEGRGQPLVRTV